MFSFAFCDFLFSDFLSSTLYSGTGPKGQDVFTWVPDTNYTVIAHDFAPLVQHLWKTGLVDGTASVGIIAFGSEMFFSTQPVTFQAKSLSVDVFDGRPKPSAAPSWKPLGGVGWLGCLVVPFVVSMLF
jgi:hypothetical protein